MPCRAQVLGAKVQLKLDSPGDAAELTDLRALLSDRNTPTRDVNGFRRMLLLTTQPGRTYAKGYETWAHKQGFKQFTNHVCEIRLCCCLPPVI